MIPALFGLVILAGGSLLLFSYWYVFTVVIVPSPTQNPSYVASENHFFGMMLLDWSIFSGDGE
jgi:hypothetical protein